MDPGSPSRSAKFAWLFCLLLVAVTVSVYYPLTSHPFVNYDDPDYITNNPHIQAGLSATTVRWAFTTYRFTVWHPLSWILHTIEYQFFGLDPAGYHAISLLLHLCNVVLLFWILLQATGYAGRSAIVAGLFALHPINVESVAWIAESKNLLSMFFFLLALGCYGWYARKPGLLRYGAVALFYSFGLLSKPMIITLPCILLLWDYWPLRRMFARDPQSSTGLAVPATPRAKSLAWLIAEKAPLFLIAGAGAYITQWALRTSGIVAARWPLPIRIENAIISYPRYIAKLFWPSHLALFYPHPGSAISPWDVGAAILILLVITAVVLQNFRRRYLLVGWFWFLGSLVPMSGIVPIPADHAMADRYMYLPFLGLFIAIGWTVAEWAQRRRISRGWVAGLSVAALLALAIVSRVQLDYWRDNVTLWTHVARVTRDNAVAEANIGAALLDERRFDEALLHFRAATAISPLDPVANLNIAYCEQQQGQLQAAIEQYKKVVVMTDRPALKAKALENLGYAYRALGDAEKAQESFAAAAALPKW